MGIDQGREGVHRVDEDEIPERSNAVEERLALFQLHLQRINHINNQSHESTIKARA